MVFVNLPSCSLIPGMRNKAVDKRSTMRAVDVWPWPLF